MDYKYTNEVLRKKFKNQFDLVKHAIEVAENMILTGREPRVKTDTQNRAMQVLAEITAGKDQLVPIIPEKNKYEDKTVEAPVPSKAASAHKAPTERKRPRKILVD